jgi:hypothetical protein
MRRHAWVLAVVPVWLAARTTAYALAPASPLGRQLEGRTGGSAPLVVTLVLAGVVLALGAGVLAVASLALRERAALAGEALAPLSRRRLLVRAAVLFALATVAFTGIEALFHLQAGLGFHGWHCLLGPVHRDALPFLGAFSVAAAAVVAALERLAAWARRLVRALRSRRARLRPRALPRPASVLLRPSLAVRPCGARGPPLLA